MKKGIIIALVVLILAVALYLFAAKEGVVVTEGAFGAPVGYLCAESKVFSAQFATEEGIARIALGDGRQFTLDKKTEDGSNIVFSNDSGVSFAVKDFGGAIIEDGTETYSQCAVAAVTEPASVPAQ